MAWVGNGDLQTKTICASLKCERIEHPLCDAEGIWNQCTFFASSNSNTINTTILKAYQKSEELLYQPLHKNGQALIRMQFKVYSRCSQMHGRPCREKLNGTQWQKALLSNIWTATIKSRGSTMCAMYTYKNTHGRAAEVKTRLLVWSNIYSVFKYSMCTFIHYV